MLLCRVVAVDTLGVPLANVSFLEVLVRPCGCVYGYGWVWLLVRMANV